MQKGQSASAPEYPLLVLHKTVPLSVCAIVLFLRLFPFPPVVDRVELPCLASRIAFLVGVGRARPVPEIACVPVLGLFVVALKFLLAAVANDARPPAAEERLVVVWLVLWVPKERLTHYQVRSLKYWSR